MGLTNGIWCEPGFDKVLQGAFSLLTSLDTFFRKVVKVRIA